jgi:hypothetical protein
VRRLLVTANVVPSSPIRITLMMEAVGSSETSVLTRATPRNIPRRWNSLYTPSVSFQIPEDGRSRNCRCERATALKEEPKVGSETPVLYVNTFVRCRSSWVSSSGRAWPLPRRVLLHPSHLPTPTSVCILPALIYTTAHRSRGLRCPLCRLIYRHVLLTGG